MVEVYRHVYNIDIYTDCLETIPSTIRLAKQKQRFRGDYVLLPAGTYHPPPPSSILLFPFLPVPFTIIAVAAWASHIMKLYSSAG